ncbi:MAG: hypothetical protein QOD06_2525 [Candidatus Binatota bacterium]|nr:hypothetical protein [Candidatus Binatota bacterium]
MQSRPRETTAGALVSLVAPQTGGRDLPPPQPISHWRNLYWWIAIAGGAALVVWGAAFFPERRRDAPRAAAKQEREAFLAIGFSRVSERDPVAIPADAFRREIAELDDAGFHAVGPADVEAFVHDGAPLPARPIVLTFDEARRETLDIADAALRDHDFRGVVFVQVEPLEQGNLQYVSWHRLTQLVASGRWEVGLSACWPNGVEKALDLITLSDSIRHGRELLEERSGAHVTAVDCVRPLDELPATDKAWARVARAASFTVGFLKAPPGANYRTDPALGLRRVRVTRDWLDRKLVPVLEASLPRREPYQDDFSRPEPSPAWMIDHGKMDVQSSSLRIAAAPDEDGAMVFLGGTERWRDAEATVEVASPPEGQFWLYLRRGGQASHVRLGISEGRVLLQRSTAGGGTRQFGSMPLPDGKVELTLRVVGSRAIAKVDGRILGDRPLAVPEELATGGVAIAVWDEDSAKASARVLKFAARPMFERAAIVPASPAESEWRALREQAPELTTVSPRYFRWENGAGSTAPRDTSLEIFAHYQHWRLLPAVRIAGALADPERRALAAEVSRWAADPAFHGINLILDGGEANEWTAWLERVRGSLAQDGKRLAITWVGARGPRNSTTSDFFLPASGETGLEIASAEPEGAGRGP